MKEHKDLGGGIVTENLRIEMPHPDPCWIIRNKEETASYSDGAGTLFIFSSEGLAKSYIEASELAGAIVRSLSWSELVDNFEKGFHSVLVDHKGNEDFYDMVPLIKNI